MIALKEREMQLLSRFRTDARTSLTDMSKQTKIPVSTIFDKLRHYEDNNIIKKHTSLIDFKKLGYDIKTQILITANKEDKEKLYIEYSK